jgi:hypothetical protein
MTGRIQRDFFTDRAAAVAAGATYYLGEQCGCDSRARWTATDECMRCHNHVPDVHQHTRAFMPRRPSGTMPIARTDTDLIGTPKPIEPKQSIEVIAVAKATKKPVPDFAADDLGRAVRD